MYDACGIPLCPPMRLPGLQAVQSLHRASVCSRTNSLARCMSGGYP